MTQVRDLLKTSSTPGYAVRCKSMEECNYEIIGAAMQNQTKSNDKISELCNKFSGSSYN
jgi:hypothetical protein